MSAAARTPRQTPAQPDVQISEGVGPAGPGPRGPALEDPNAVHGRPSQLAVQRRQMGLDRSEEAAAGDDAAIDGASSEVTDNSQPAKTSPGAMVGKSGMVFTDGGRLHLRAGPGTDEKSLDLLPDGSPLEFTGARGDWLKTIAWPNKKETEGWVHGGYVKEQPGLDKSDKPGDTDHGAEGVRYQKVEGAAFNGDPTVDDVKQRQLGDCYLMAALGAMASTADGKKALKDMVTPDGEAASYTVTFKKKRLFKTISESRTVDNWFPMGPRHQYAETGGPGPTESPLWPAIIEKAFASWKGSYDDIERGHAEKAIKEMTGLSSKETPLSDFSSDESLLEAMQGALERGEAVTAASIHTEARSYTGKLDGTGLGPFVSEPDAASAVEGSVKITDDGKEGLAPKVTDDGKGTLSSRAVGDKKERATGTVDYKKVSVAVTYPQDHAPAAAADLRLKYKAYRQISESPDVRARHAYVVRGVSGGKIDLHNPWGFAHPGKVDVATFRRFFRKFTNSVMPDGTVA